MKTYLESITERDDVVNSYGDLLLHDFRGNIEEKKKRLKKTYKHLRVRKKLLNEQFIRP